MKPTTVDYATYEAHLTSTEDGDGRVHRDQAIKLLADDFRADANRLDEMAWAAATRVADRFDDARSHNVDGQIQITADTFLKLGGAERIHVSKAKAYHWREWWALQQQAHLREQRAFIAKADLFDLLLPILEEHDCTVLQAQRIADVGVAA